MPIRLTLQEKEIAKRLAKIKESSGSHSPSPAMLAAVKGVTVKHDFCYLSNPYATDLFLKYARRDFKNVDTLRLLVEHYPSQNKSLAEKLVSMAGVSAKNIFVGNGATEIIHAVLANFVGVKLPQSRRSLTPTMTPAKILVPIPTFSPYLEFAPEGVTVVMHQLQKETNFQLDIHAFLSKVKKEKPDAVVLINPNNPDGGYVGLVEVQKILHVLRGTETVIVDESFIHFAGDTDGRRYRNADRRGFSPTESVTSLVRTYPNLIVVKSLSKDFGIAGLRLGYAVMSEKRVSALLEKGYLWNVSGFGEYFLNLLSRPDFLRAYEKNRMQAVGERDLFYTELSKIKELRVCPSRGNFFLVELLDGTTAHDLMVRLLVQYGIYIRPCGDKAGLNGEYVRVASRRKKENKLLVEILKKSLVY